MSIHMYYLLLCVPHHSPLSSCNCQMLRSCTLSLHSLSSLLHSSLLSSLSPLHTRLSPPAPVRLRLYFPLHLCCSPICHVHQGHLCPLPLPLLSCLYHPVLLLSLTLSAPILHSLLSLKIVHHLQNHPWNNVSLRKNMSLSASIALSLHSLHARLPLRCSAQVTLSSLLSQITPIPPASL